MKIKNIEKRGNRKEGVNLIIEVLEKDVIPKGNRKLLNRRNFYKQHLTSLGFSHVRGKYVIQLDDENEIETMKTLLESYRTKYQSYPNSYKFVAKTHTLACGILKYRKKTDHE